MIDFMLTVIALLCAIPGTYFIKVILRQTGISQKEKKQDRNDILDDLP